MAAVLITILLAIPLVTLTIVTHYELLFRASRILRKKDFSERVRVLLSMGAVFLAHLLSVLIYMLGYIILWGTLDDAGLAGEFDGDLLDFFYFSMMSYTTLGVGDVYPVGALRILSGVQALNGFVMVGWSASFAFWMVQRFWN